MNKEIELLIRKTALKDVEIWLNEQYKLINDELMTFTEDRNDDSAKKEFDQHYLGEDRGGADFTKD